MDIKDYLHLYLGCQGRVSIDYGFPMRGMKIVSCDLIGIVGEIVTLECYDINGTKWDAEHICRFDRFKPILRPLSDITLQDFKGLVSITTSPEKIAAATDEQYQESFTDWKEEGTFEFDELPATKAAKIVAYLLTKHFDLFGLIENGLAIDKTKI